MKTIYYTLILLFISINITAQKKAKDTIFFAYDDQYIYTKKDHPDRFYIKETTQESTEFFFEKEPITVRRLNYKGARDLKLHVRSTEAYHKEGDFIVAYRLMAHMSKKVVILVKLDEYRMEFIKVSSTASIDD